MKIGVYPADHSACGHYRLILPALALAEEGYDVTVHFDGVGMANAIVREHKDGTCTVLGGTLPDEDVIVLQRPSAPDVAAFIAYLVEHGKHVVVDVDDRFDAIDSRNSAWHYYNHSPLAIRSLRSGLAAATVVTCSTPDLAALHGGLVVENCVPATYLDLAGARDPVVGWTGSLAVHPRDLAVVGGGFARALDAHPDWSVRIVGEAIGTGTQLGLPADPPGTGWLHIRQYPEAVARLGLGLAPLEDTPFNRAKSWLKALEYSALGVPFVASALPEYARLGAGTLATNPRQWKGAVNALLADADRRDEQVAANRTIAERWTIENRLDTWVAAWIPR